VYTPQFSWTGLCAPPAGGTRSYVTIPETWVWSVSANVCVPRGSEPEPELLVDNVAAKAMAATANPAATMSTAPATIPSLRRRLEPGSARCDVFAATLSLRA
jgi:hypothetical protein